METKKLILNFEKELSNLVEKSKSEIKTIKTKNQKEKEDIRNKLSIQWERLIASVEIIRLKIGEL